MKVVCLQENLKHSISYLERIVSRNQNTPILSNILLKADGGMLVLFGTDLEVSVDVAIPCKVEKKGEVVVPIKLITHFIQNLPNTKITIEEKGNKLFIEAEDTKTTIPTASKNEFPLIPKIKPELSIEIQPEPLKTGLLQVLNSTAISYSIPEISGIFFDFKQDLMKIVSTDSFRLSEKVVYKKNNFQMKGEYSFILPQKTAQELARVIEQSAPIFIHLEQNQAHFKFEHINIISRLISGTYPNYEQIIPKHTKTKISLNKTEFSSKVKLAGGFTSKLNDVKFTAHVKKGTLEVRAADEAKGDLLSVIHAEMGGGKHGSGFQPQIYP